MFIKSLNNDGKGKDYWKKAYYLMAEWAQDYLPEDVKDKIEKQLEELEKEVK